MFKSGHSPSSPMLTKLSSMSFDFGHNLSSNYSIYDYFSTGLMKEDDDCCIFFLLLFLLELLADLFFFSFKPLIS